ncbi:hypothetical protein SMB34_02320 [Thalassospira permensis NBRC 106175]|uniref:Uncharacterized protein n=1 Tax=Thalassospira permensis NBRC 106175 TaxID=1353532 RepID=A0ABR4TVK2_9PROT|nr:hypothetical protein SMB34_02320 [Thalassospira permensis NBRC 106175]
MLPKQQAAFIFPVCGSVGGAAIEDLSEAEPGIRWGRVG